MKTFILSPVGYIIIEQSKFAIEKISFVGDKKPDFKKEHSAMLEKCENQLKNYFKGKLQHFHLPLDLKGSPFQIKVWKETAKIPFGKTLTYSELAKNIGHPKAYRAVGNALGKNPIPIIIPCHRVVSKQGLGGFSATFKIKKYLLEFEKRTSQSI